MKRHLFDAAGNRVLWLDAGVCLDTAFDRLADVGLPLATNSCFGQELTAILFRTADGYRSLFWNMDGTPEMICGNAIRCLAHFLSQPAAPVEEVAVETPSGRYISRRIDDQHGAVVIPSEAVKVAAALLGDDLFVDVGTPHRIRRVDREWPEEHLREAARRSTCDNPVNFSLFRSVEPNLHRVRVFERGVGETSSCGTAAVAIAAALSRLTDPTQPANHRHVMQFASLQQLIVTRDSQGDTYELSGAVTLERDLSF